VAFDLRDISVAPAGSRCMDENTMLAIGSLKRRDRLKDLLRQLTAAGFSEAAVSLMVPDHELGTDPADEPPREGSDKLRDLTLGAASGGLLLGTLGGLIGLASLAIPGLWLFLVGGPLAVALGDAIAGGAVGAVAGALIGMRIPDHQAKQYEESLRHGGAIVSVHAHNQTELESAMKILADTGAEDLHQVRPQRSTDAGSLTDGRDQTSALTTAGKDYASRKPSKQHRQQPLPEEIEEAEQDAGDPTHEKEVPPK